MNETESNRFPTMTKIKNAIESEIILIRKANVDWGKTDPRLSVYLGSETWDGMRREYDDGGCDISIDGGTLFGGGYNVYKVCNVTEHIGVYPIMEGR